MAESVTSEVGKIGPDFFQNVIFPRLGARRHDVLVGPRHGIDAGVVDLDGGRVMVLSTDPFFVVPEYGWERAGWLAVQIVLSDVATSGLAPSHLTVDLNLPCSMTDVDLAALWESVHAACLEAGVSIVTGHTGRYDGCTFPMVGAATGLAFGAADELLTPAMAAPGDIVIATKGPAMEATALIGVVAPRTLEAALGTEIARAAEDLFSCLSVVRDAAVAVEVGVRDRGVTAMHDAAERGILGGLVEIAGTSGCGLLVDLDSMPLRQEVAAVCSLFDIDPFTASSEGTLLLACRPAHAAAVARHLEAAGIAAFQIGEMLSSGDGMWVMRDGRRHLLQAPASDPFWPAYLRALQMEAAC